KISNKNSSYYEGSNQTRKESQLVGFRIGVDSPFLGVGFGQYGFYFKKYVRNYSFEIKELLKPGNNDWISTHGLLARIFAEIGFFGVGIWLSIWMYLIYKFVLLFRILKNNDFDDFVVVLFINILSFQLLLFATDTFRYLFYWLVISLSEYVIYCYERKFKNIC
ncbi:MAG: hypothetical protein NC925_02840, partial [Candidatus Omnitrophica bacterium]|nr:hypothetical protein [Candidatus Omnitrophota bacterium]